MEYRITNHGTEPIDLGPDYDSVKPGASEVIAYNLRNYRPMLRAVRAGTASLEVVPKLGVDTMPSAPPPAGHAPQKDVTPHRDEGRVSVGSSPPPAERPPLVEPEPEPEPAYQIPVHEFAKQSAPMQKSILAELGLVGSDRNSKTRTSAYADYRMRQL